MATYGIAQPEAAERALQLADVLNQVELRDIAGILTNYSKVRPPLVPVRTFSADCACNVAMVLNE